MHCITTLYILIFSFQNHPPTYTATVLSDYQEVFQQMKLQNPNTSLGALQQKTIQRMSELKVEREEMERMNMERLKELEKA